MKIAFYKATRPGVQGIYNRLVRLFDGSIYSHAELVFSDGISASSSYMDGGVRFKNIEFDLNKWDLFDISEFYSEDFARNWFELYEGKEYDVMGNLRVVITWWPHSKVKWHCTEAIAEALQINNSDLFGPKKLFEELDYKPK